jgi:tetratricopeptide (TPR) repeat protein
VQIKPPLLRTIDPPAPDATAADLEARAEQLRASKLYLDALDYYRAALAKEPNSASLLNKIGITNLMMQRNREAKKWFDQSIKADRKYADAYNNRAVALYEEQKYGAAIKDYRRAIAIDDTSASFYSNLGAALFAKKDFEPAVLAYERAVQIDPDVFERTSRGGVQAQLPSPGDRARYDFTVAKLYAKMGYADRSLEYLKKALEAGYKDFNSVYKDAEFAELRKDKRFTELMAAKPVALTN